MQLGTALEYLLFPYICGTAAYITFWRHSPSRSVRWKEQLWLEGRKSEAAWALVGMDQDFDSSFTVKV